MNKGADDIRFRELKDTITQLNITVRTQNELMVSLKDQLDQKGVREQELNQLISNLQAEIAWLRARLYGSSSEHRKDMIPGQTSKKPMIFEIRNRILHNEYI